MATTQIVHCPNCGCLAQRDLIAQSEVPASVAHKCSADPFIIRTTCHQCDYLMTQCPRSSTVLEAHAPGVSSLMLQNHHEARVAAPAPSVLQPPRRTI